MQNTEQQDIYTRVTGQIIASLEQGVRPWIKPWNGEHAIGRITRPLRANGVPYNSLYDQGYKSIGCAPCTRPVPDGHDSRSGRWWWETGAPKECGMHCAIETGGFEHELAALLEHKHV